MTGPAALWVTGVNEPGRPAEGGRGVQHEADVYAWMTPQQIPCGSPGNIKAVGKGEKLPIRGLGLLEPSSLQSVTQGSWATPCPIALGQSQSRSSSCTLKSIPSCTINRIYSHPTYRACLKQNASAPSLTLRTITATPILVTHRRITAHGRREPRGWRAAWSGSPSALSGRRAEQRSVLRPGALEPGLPRDRPKGSVIAKRRQENASPLGLVVAIITRP